MAEQRQPTGVIAVLAAVGVIAYAMIYSGVMRLQGQAISTIGALTGDDPVPIPAAGAQGGPAQAPTKQPAPASVGSAVVSAARAHIGRPYRWAAPGVTPSSCAGARSYDCSGLAMCAWWEGAGVKLPHNAALQAQVADRIGRKHAAPGDLVFMYHPIDHVAIFAGGGRMIEAPFTGAKVREVAVPWSIVVGLGRPRIPPPAGKGQK